MKQYLVALFFALQLTVVQVQAVNIGTDPVGNAKIREEDDREEGRQEERQENRAERRL